MLRFPAECVELASAAAGGVGEGERGTLEKVSGAAGTDCGAASLSAGCLAGREIAE